MKAAMVLGSTLMLLTLASTAVADSGENSGEGVIMEVFSASGTALDADTPPDPLPPEGYIWVWDPITQTWIKRPIEH